MPFESITYRRHELHAEIWKEPLTTVAARYGVSDVAFAKACRRLAIPLPGRGHWARVAAGEVIATQPLRKLPAGRVEEFVGRRWKAPSGSAETNALVEKEERAEARVVVPEALTEPHEFVTLTARWWGIGPRRSGRDKRCLRINVSRPLIDLCQERDPAVRRDRSAVEPQHDFAPRRPFEPQLPITTLCLHHRSAGFGITFVW